MRSGFFGLEFNLFAHQAFCIKPPSKKDLHGHRYTQGIRRVFTGNDVRGHAIVEIDDSTPPIQALTERASRPLLRGPEMVFQSAMMWSVGHSKRGMSWFKEEPVHSCNSRYNEDCIVVFLFICAKPISINAGVLDAHG